MKINQLLIHLKRLDNDKLYKAVSGGLREAINYHGVIPKSIVPSVSKRIVGQIKTLIHNLEQEKENKKEDWEKEEWGGWKIVSNMLDNPDKYGIYPTSKCYRELYEFVMEQKEKAQQEMK